MQRSCQKTSCSDLVKRPCEENRDLAKRSYRELEQRSYLEISCRDLAWRSLTNTLYRDLVQRLQRLATKDVDEGSLHRTFCTGPSTDILTNGSCTAAFTEILSRRSCTRSSTESFAKKTCRLYPGISSLCTLQHCLGPLAGMM